MNVLISTLSILPKNRNTYFYEVRLPECEKKFVEASYTNESIFLAIKLLLKEKNIDRVILLVSNVVKNDISEIFGKTALDYFTDIVKSNCSSVIIDCIDLEKDDNSDRDTSIILSEVSSKINVGDDVYIDAAGGKRTMPYLIQVLIKILQYKGVGNTYSLYSNIQNEVKYIEDTSSFQSMMSLADAFNEFVTSGKSEQLGEHFIKTKECVNVLLKTISEFSDKIRLGNVDDIGGTIIKLRRCIAECSRENMESGIEESMLKVFLPVIEKKLIGNNKNGEVDYCKLVRWCLENGFIQQALTLFTEKIAISIFDKGIIKYEGNIDLYIREYKNRPKTPMDATDWQTNALYKEFMSEDNSLVEEAKNYLKYGNQNFSERIKPFIQELKNIKKCFSMQKLNNISSNTVLNFIEKQNIQNYKSFISALHNNDTLIKSLLGVRCEKKDTLATKFNVVTSIEKGHLIRNHFYSTVDQHKICPVLYGYLYAKSQRNRINHASSEENLSQEQCEKLKKFGYKFEPFDVKTIRHNLSIALDSIDNCRPKQNEIGQIETIQHKPTSHKRNDRVIAICGSLKRVNIEDEDYDIPLVVPKLKMTDPKSLIGKTFNVVVRQISKEGKIVQVEYC